MDTGGLFAGLQRPEHEEYRSLNTEPATWHAAEAAGKKLVITLNSRRMLVGEFRVTWDTVSCAETTEYVDVFI
jgi:hypothetical protein